MSQLIPAKKESWAMFNRIASRYDLLNRIISFNIDKRWRNKVIKYLPQKDKMLHLDLATGTADQILLMLNKTQNISHSTGIDLSKNMLKIGKLKITNKGYEDRVNLLHGDATNLNMENHGFDVVTMTFGIRNVSDTNKCLEEMFRLLKNGGRTIILEFSIPKNKVVKLLYLFYFRYMLPLLGGMISGNYKAYKYLNSTVEAFPYGEQFCELMRISGFKNVKAVPLTFGIATIYCGDKIDS